MVDNDASECWPRARFPVLNRVPTRWGGNDHSGHVNNVVFSAWSDTTVNATLIERCRCDIRKLSAVGFAVETSCRYVAPLSSPAVVDVGLAVELLGSTSVVYRLAVFGEGEDTPAALGRFVHVYVDRHERRPVSVPDVIRRSMGSPEPVQIES